MRHALKTQPPGKSVRLPATWISFAFIQLAFVSVCFGVSEPGTAVDEKPGFRESGMLIYDAAVQGRPVRCIVDTGSTVSVVDGIVCRVDVPAGSRLKKTNTSSSTLEVPVIDNIMISFGGWPTGVTSPIVWDLKAFDQIVGQEIGAIIGMDLLADQVLSIVSGQPTVVNSVPEIFSAPSISHHTYSERSRPVLPIDLPVYGNRDFIIDTGNNAALIIADELAQALVRSRRAVVGIEREFVGLEGTQWGRTIIIQQIHISGVVFRNVPASIGKSNSIGMSLLTRLKIAVDFRNQRVYLDPAASTSVSEFPLNASGMYLLFVSNKKLRVQNVRKDSPASRAGVQPGDEVLSIDGKEPADFSFDELMQIVSHDGQTIRIAFRRSGRDYDLDLTLKRRFEYPPVWKLPLIEEGDFSEFLKRKPEE